MNYLLSFNIRQIKDEGEKSITCNRMISFCAMVSSA